MEQRAALGLLYVVHSKCYNLSRMGDLNFFSESFSLGDIAREIGRLAIDEWGRLKPTLLIGRHPALIGAVEKIARYARSDSPVLLTGETGTGKELFARGIYLLSARRRRPWITVNCAQYHDGQLIASELFGHRRGSFTGAVNDHRGVFEVANGGTVFLDEVGELSLAAQAMLLRTLSEGEIVPVGDTQARQVDVRVIAATSRDLRAMIDRGQFRPDLYYRLRVFHVRVPAVRERGDDWELIAAYYLQQHIDRHRTRKVFSAGAADVLRKYDWPGNVRELKSVVETACSVSDDVIEPHDFAAELEAYSRDVQLRRVTAASPVDLGIDRMAMGGETFWDVVHKPFLDREMSRSVARDIVAAGLKRTNGNYKRLLDIFGVAPSDYLKFMDFLRHQKLKPDAPEANPR